MRLRLTPHSAWTGMNKTVYDGSMMRLMRVFTCTLVLWMAACTHERPYPEPPRSGSEVLIDVSGLQEGRPLFLSYRTSGKNVNFFLLRMGDRVSSFLDACVTCYRKKQGYRSEEGLVVCQACGQRFSVHQLEQGLGGCYPIKLEGRLRNGSFVIPVASLEAAAERF